MLPIMAAALVDCRYPVWRQCRRRNAIESSAQYNRKETEETLSRSRCRDSRRNIYSTPTSDVVWRTGRSALFVGKKESGPIQGAATVRNILTQLRPRTPQQCHGAGDVWRRHR